MTRQTRNNKGTPSAIDHLRCKPVKHCSVISDTQYPCAQAACHMSKVCSLNRKLPHAASKNVLKQFNHHAAHSYEFGHSVKRNARQHPQESFLEHRNTKSGMCDIRAAYPRVLWVGYT